jgi:hypothetical protein
MVNIDTRNVRVTTRLTKYGEVEFKVVTSKGSFANKCLHDALSEAGIKMTGIGGILAAYETKLDLKRDFKISRNEFRSTNKGAGGIR